MSALIDLTGQRFGRLVVVGRAPNRVYHPRKQSAQWHCRCDCGAHPVVLGGHLRRGAVKSCGCYNRDVARSNNTKHGNARRIAPPSPEYRTWGAMKWRCGNPASDRYKYYGGRGITVCARWAESFEAFLEDMGPKPSPKHSIDRIDVDGNYEPGNCRWATHSEQQLNKRTEASDARS